MAEIQKAALIGCGDFLRWLIDSLNESKILKVTKTFDLSQEKSEARASQLHAVAVKSTEDIFNDDEISIVLIFTPPWARTELFEKAVKAGKHIITTKPLAPNVKAAQNLVDIVNGKVKCGVNYGRTGDPVVEMLKKIFESKEIGKLALYKEDWFHHYPTWNDWATDPEKNGGPFMDAMVHNLNKARYLMGRKEIALTYSSDNYSQSLKCNDTESLKIDFEGNAAAFLFITWAAELDVHDISGNDREHFGITHYITDQGWYVEEIEKNGEAYIKAHKNKVIKEWKVEPLPHSCWDQFVIDVMAGKNPEPDVQMAYEDIKLMDIAVKNCGERISL